MGLGCGMSTVPPRIYMSEFTLPNMRGVVGAIPNFSVALGITLQAIDLNYFIYICSCYATIFFLHFTIPLWLLLIDLTMIYGAIQCNVSKLPP